MHTTNSSDVFEWLRAQATTTGLLAANFKRERKDSGLILLRRGGGVCVLMICGTIMGCDALNGDEGGGVGIKVPFTSLFDSGVDVRVVSTEKSSGNSSRLGLEIGVLTIGHSRTSEI